jgi:hypothetical protein
VQRLPEEVISQAPRIFWDVDIASIDPIEHEDFIIARVLEEGDWNSVRALRREIGDDGIRAFCRRAGHRLDKRTQRFFETVLGLEPGTCRKTSWRSASESLFQP